MDARKPKRLLPVTGLERWMVVADNHGDSIDPVAGRVAIDFCNYFKPHRRIHLGDGFNFDWLRRSASVDEQRGTPDDDIAGGIEFIRAYKPTDYCLGNHEFRIDKLRESTNGPMASFACKLWDDIHAALGKKCVVYKYDKRRGVLRHGNYTLVHGYAAGIGALRKMTLAYGNVMVGHIHRCEEVKVERLDGAVGYAIGTLARLDLHYNVVQLGTLAQEHGFCYGWKWPSGKLIVMRAKNQHGRWVMPTECLTHG